VFCVLLGRHSRTKETQKTKASKMAASLVHGPVSSATFVCLICFFALGFCHSSGVLANLLLFPPVRASPGLPQELSEPPKPPQASLSFLRPPQAPQACLWPGPRRVRAEPILFFLCFLSLCHPSCVLAKVLPCPPLQASPGLPHGLFPSP
jgi:hypothetical protein